MARHTTLPITIPDIELPTAIQQAFQLTATPVIYARKVTETKTFLVFDMGDGKCVVARREQSSISAWIPLGDRTEQGRSAEWFASNNNIPRV